MQWCSLLVEFTNSYEKKSMLIRSTMVTSKYYNTNDKKNTFIFSFSKIQKKHQ